jgi:hypothetical protein
MNARGKLNRAYLNGSLLIAGAVGLVTQSWTIFAVTFVVLLVMDVCSDNIRLRRRRK